MFARLPQLLRVTLTIAAWVVAGYLLHRYEYFRSFGSVDNIIGILPVTFVLTGAIGTTVLLWLRHTRRLAPVSGSIALLVVLSMVLFPTALRGNWWIAPAPPIGSQAAVDLTIYAPFSPNSRAVRLGETAELRLTEDLPLLDGATALYPVYAAFAEAVYDEAAFVPDDVRCSNTAGAYQAIIAGDRDVIFVAGAARQQMAAARAAGVDLHFTPIGREALVFLVGQNNPVDNLTRQQLRNVYSGKTAYWSTLGWPAGGRIIAFQRPADSGSQTGLHQMVMADLPIQVPQPLPDASLVGTNSLLQQVSVEWRGVQPAMGYSYRYYATVMYRNPDAKILKIDGVEPSAQNIRNGRYPFVSDFYAVTNGAPQGNTKLLIDWILSPQGQKIIERTGYTPMTKTGR